MVSVTANLWKTLPIAKTRPLRTESALPHHSASLSTPDCVAFRLKIVSSSNRGVAKKGEAASVPFETCLLGRVFDATSTVLTS